MTPRFLSLLSGLRELCLRFLHFERLDRFQECIDRGTPASVHYEDFTSTTILGPIGEATGLITMAVVMGSGEAATSYGTYQCRFIVVDGISGLLMVENRGPDRAAVNNG